MEGKRRLWRLVLCAGSASLMLCFGGCAGDETESNPYAVEFEEALLQAESDYVRDILADGELEESEFRDAMGHVEQCLADNGIPLSYVDDEFGELGLQLDVDIELSEGQWAQTDACLAEWMTPIDILHYRIASNPNNDDREDLTAACLVRKGLAPQGFTGADYEELNYQDKYLSSSYMDEATGEITYKPAQIPLTGVLLPNGEIADFDAPGVWGCLFWPLL